jgi:hypothetical protein
MPIHVHVHMNGDGLKRSRQKDPDDSRFAESPLTDPADIVARIRAAKNVTELRQVLSELETARKEEVFVIAKAYTGQVPVSTKQGINLIWRKWYISNVSE